MFEVPEILPDWITEEEIQYYAREYDRTGWTGPLNIYRGINKYVPPQSARPKLLLLVSDVCLILSTK